MSFWAFSSLMPGLARQNTEVRLFRAFSLVGGAALAAGNLSGSGLIGAAHLFGVLVGVLAPLILHFHLVLVGIRLGRWRWPVLAVIYAAGAAVAIPYLLPGPVSHWWRAEWGSRGLRLLLGGALLGSLFCLFYGYVTARSPEARRRLRLIVLGTSWGFAPVLGLSLLPDLLGFPFIPYPITLSFLVLIPFAYWQAILRFDLLRVDLVLNRSLVYLILTFTLIGAYLLALRLSDLFLPGIAFHRELVGVLLLVVAGLAGLPFRNLIQRAVDRAFYGGWYDYRSVVSDISHSLAGTLERRELELILERAIRILWVRGAALLLPEPQSVYRLRGRRYGDFPVDPSLLTLDTEGVLGRRLSALHWPVETIQLRQQMASEHLEPASSALLAHQAIRWWLPMVSGEGLVGLLLLGARLGDERFDVDDLQILRTLGDQAALAIKNILLIERLRFQFEEIERNHLILEQMHQKLLRSHEKERKHLARYLHGGPIQQLIAFRYQLRECAARIGDPKMQAALDGLREEAGALLDELRGLCAELRPSLLDLFGLAAAIRAHSEGIGHRHGLEIQAMLDEDKDHQLPEETAMSLFRIYQEALSNVTRHADASQVMIRLAVTDSQAVLQIQDNGKGFTVPDPVTLFAADGHFGLLGIHEWVELLKGKFELFSQLGAGTRLCVRVPLCSDASR